MIHRLLAAALLLASVAAACVLWVAGVFWLVAVVG